MEYKLNLSTVPFSLEHTLDCGQLFRWKKIDDWWYGVVEERVVKLRQSGEKLFFHVYPGAPRSDFLWRYLRLDDDLPSILGEINRDKHVAEAIKLFRGLRICRQEPWECLVSYVCATYKSIPAIKLMVNNLAKRFGKKLTFDGFDFYTFPKPVNLAKACPEELRACGLGFRAERVLEVAKKVESGKLHLESLKNVDYSEAKRMLLQLPGVGDKVADCVLLFSLEKLEAFPVDVWMKRAATSFYAHHFDSAFIKKVSGKTSLTSREYSVIGSFARQYFGRYAGYAQEYLFHLLRSKNKNKQKC